MNCYIASLPFLEVFLYEAQYVAILKARVADVSYVWGRFLLKSRTSPLSEQKSASSESGDVLDLGGNLPHTQETSATYPRFESGRLLRLGPNTSKNKNIPMSFE